MLCTYWELTTSLRRPTISIGTLSTDGRVLRDSEGKWATSNSAIGSCFNGEKEEERGGEGGGGREGGRKGGREGVREGRRKEGRGREGGSRRKRTTNEIHSLELI